MVKLIRFSAIYWLHQYLTHFSLSYLKCHNCIRWMCYVWANTWNKITTVWLQIVGFVVCCGWPSPDDSLNNINILCVSHHVVREMGSWKLTADCLTIGQAVSGPLWNKWMGEWSEKEENRNWFIFILDSSWIISRIKSTDRQSGPAIVGVWT